MSGLEATTMITASAGTGKTFTITERIARRLADGLPVDAVLATTFTRKAAGELKERIAARLLDTAARHEADGNPEGARLMREAAQGLPASLIGTVNSVCDSLLREFAIDLGLSPELETIAEEEQAGLFAIAVDDTLAEYAGRNADLLARTGGDDGGWQEQVRRICGEARANMIEPDQLRKQAHRSWDALAARLPGPSAGDPRPHWQHLARQFSLDLEAVLASGTDPDGKPVKTEAKNFKKAVPEVRQVLERVLRADAAELPWDTWRSLASLSGAPAWMNRMHAPLAEAMGEDTGDDGGLLGAAPLHADLEALIVEAFRCAADCLEGFADFKRGHGLLDFTDQETLVARALQDNAGFRESFRQRVRFLVVDEFQDTSPLQLRLFLTMSELAGEAVWVGDPKQAIYSFRGTDPELMASVVEAAPTVERLRYSWRSHQQVLDATNAAFAPVFGALGLAREDVEVSLPPARAGDTGGSLHAWTLQGRTKPEAHACLAAGVRDLLADRTLPGGPVPAGRTAVLVRTNAEARAVADALDALGVRSSVPGEGLLGAREAQLVRAGMAWVANPRDTVALAELVALLPGHAAHSTWQAGLLSGAEPADTHARWAADPVLAGLHRVREAAAACTPTEVLEEVVAALGVVDLVKAWSDPASRLRTLDLLRGALDRYYETCLARRRPGTLRGALAFLAADEATGAEDAGGDVVNVLTYHKAKGLEWDAVVAYSLDTEPRSGVFGAHVQKAEAFDVADPLAGRWIRYWPNPFGSQLLVKHLAGCPEDQESLARHTADLARLFYVGLTRPRRHLVLAAPGAAPQGLNALGVPDLAAWDDGGLTLGGRSLPARVGEYAADDGGVASAPPAPRAHTDASPAGPADYAPARVRASGDQAAAGAEVPVELGATLGEPLIAAGAAGWDRVGSAIHAYLGTGYAALDGPTRLRLAGTILARWGVERLVGPETLVEAGRRLDAHLLAEYPGARLHTEAAIGWFNADSQTMEGWIDLLVETDDGFVVVDHKSYPGRDPAGHIREKYVGQLDLYARAVEDATGQPVVGRLVHLPARGEIYSVGAPA